MQHRLARTDGESLLAITGHTPPGAVDDQAVSPAFARWPQQAHLSVSAGIRTRPAARRADDQIHAPASSHSTVTIAQCGRFAAVTVSR